MPTGPMFPTAWAILLSGIIHKAALKCLPISGCEAVVFKNVYLKPSYIGIRALVCGVKFSLWKEWSSNSPYYGGANEPIGTIRDQLNPLPLAPTNLVSTPRSGQHT